MPVRTHTRLIDDLSRLERRIAEAAEKSPRNGRFRKAMRTELLRVLNGSGTFEQIPAEVPSTVALTDRIQNRIGRESDYALPRAVYEHVGYDSTVASFIARRQIRRSEWDFLNRLARELGLPIDYGFGEMEDRPPWMIDVDESRQYLRVWIRELALQDMLLASMEAYLVPAGPGRSWTEIYGLVFGSLRAAQKPSRVPIAMVDLNVERICIQHRAYGSPSEVTADERSEGAHLAMAEELFPYWHLLGDFHTHTFRNLEEIHENRGWRYSKWDEKVNVEWNQRVRALGHRPRVALILTIAHAGRQSTGAQEAWRGQHNVLRATIGRCHCFISAYRIRPDGRYSSDGISLKCPHLAGQA